MSNNQFNVLILCILFPTAIGSALVGLVHITVWLVGIWVMCWMLKKAYDAVKFAVTNPKKCVKLLWSKMSTAEKVVYALLFAFILVACFSK